jgi:hypothetical protein
LQTGQALAGEGQNLPHAARHKENLANNSVDKMTDLTSRLFMDVQLQCAQCHDHPFVRPNRRNLPEAAPEVLPGRSGQSW